MESALSGVLVRWGDFYLITGSAAAALTGLQFVVQTLIATVLPRFAAGPEQEAGIGAFGTPTVVHFAMALLVSAIMSAPWDHTAGLHVALVLTGVGALGYSAIVLRRALRQTVYVPLVYDWVWHLVFPVVAYGLVTVSAFAIGHGERPWPFFAVGAATVLLLVVGIHNSWDTVTYLTLRAFGSEADEGTGSAASEQTDIEQPSP